MADEGFLQRWSRRKAEARGHLEEPEPAPGPDQERPAAPDLAEPKAPAPAAEAPARDADDAAPDLDALPDIETLTYESDFTVFMRKGVPPELRRRALQRLWRSHPTLANLDGLIDYAEDYSQTGAASQAVRTAYRIGRGMLERTEPKEAAGEPPAPAAAATTAAAGRSPTPPDAVEPDPAAPGPDRPAAGEGADAAIALAAERPEEASREGRKQRPGERTRAAKKPRPVPGRG